jgi:hypothetical protein
MVIKLSPYTLDDFELLGGILRHVSVKDERYSDYEYPLKKLGWALQKNVYIKTKKDKKKRINEILSNSPFSLSMISNGDQTKLQLNDYEERMAKDKEQIIQSFSSPLEDLPLHINHMDDPLARIIIHWRMEIGK